MGRHAEGRNQAGEHSLIQAAQAKMPTFVALLPHEHCLIQCSHSVLRAWFQLIDRSNLQVDGVGKHQTSKLPRHSN